MGRAETIRTGAFIALPFLLLPVGVWAAETVNESTLDLQWWRAVRWSLRAVYIGGALWGWLAGRPRWFYPWLGFASYEATVILLLLFHGIVPDSHSLFNTLVSNLFTFGFLALISPFQAGPTFWPRDFLLFLLVFAPYLTVALGFGWQRSRRLLALYTVFPHAALTLPLFFFAERGALSSSDFVTLLPAAVTAAAVAVFFHRQSSDELSEKWDWVRTSTLYFGVPLSNLGLLLGFSLVGHPGSFDGAMFALILSTYIGWLLLSAPLLLPPLLQLPTWLYRTGIRSVFE